MLIVIGGEEARPVEHCHQACNQGDSLTDGAELRLTKLVHMVTNATGHHCTLVAKMRFFCYTNNTTLPTILLSQNIMCV